MQTNQVSFGADYSKTFYLLPKNISAIQAFPDGEGRLRMGTLIQLPEGAKVEISGDGFDGRTARITWEGVCYFIFRDDIQEDYLYKVNAARAR
ncbi:MAG TPA: hypothetical protein VE641_07770 [Chthoniobacterales bacterium]|jgi:hypothetical protein|nr:hypothetical protein [Chthoniobacterales bacterium]